MRYLIFLILIVKAMPAWAQMVFLKYEDFSVDRKNEGNEKSFKFVDKLNNSVSFTQRIRYQKQEHLVTLDKTFIPIDKLLITAGGSLGENSQSFEKFSAFLKTDYYKIAPFNFTTRLSHKVYNDLNLNQLMLGVHWETPQGFLLMGQSFISQIVGAGDENTNLSYLAKVLFLGQEYRPYLFYSVGKEATILLEQSELTIYDIASFGVGSEFKIRNGYFLSLDYYRLKLIDFDREIDFSSLSIGRKW